MGTIGYVLFGPEDYLNKRISRSSTIDRNTASKNCLITSKEDIDYMSKIIMPIIYIMLSRNLRLITL